MTEKQDKDEKTGNALHDCSSNKMARGALRGAGIPPQGVWSFPKQCSCGAIYEESEWETLPFHGVARGTDASTGRIFGHDLEIRVCRCGSSMGQYIKIEEFEEPRGTRA